MKKYFLILCIAIFAVVSAKAQDTLLVNSKATVKGAPYLINYQAIAKDAAGNILANTFIGTTFRIYNSANLVVYSETGPKVKTNASGMLTYKIGTAEGSADKFAAIDWAADTYMLDITLRIGTTAVWMGRTSIVSVPYAFYANKANVAKTAENVINYTAGEGIAIENNTIKNTKPAQTLSLKGDTLFISGGNFVVIPGISCLQPCNTNDTLKYIWFKTDQTQLDSIHFEIGSSGLKAGYTVDWGDGITEKINLEDGVYETKNAKHKYNSNGVYTVKVYGDLSLINLIRFANNFSNPVYNTIVDFDFTNAEEMLNLYFNNLIVKKASFPQETKLTQLMFDNTFIETIDLSNNIDLQTIFIHNNKNLTSLDLSSNVNLSHAYLSNNNLSSLDLSNNPSLKIVEAGYNNINNINLTNLNELEILRLERNQLSNIDLSTNTKLKSLWLTLNNLNSLNVDNLLFLEELLAAHNRISSINLSNNTNLTSLTLSANQIENIDVSNNTKLEAFEIGVNPISNLSIQNNIELKYLFINNSNIKELNISNNNKLIHLGVQYCSLSSGQVDKFLVDMLNSVNSSNRNSGNIVIDHNAVPSSIGIQAKNQLMNSYQWGVVTD